MTKKKNEGERQMLFDIRGRRKNVVKVVYAILAVLMGLSLFLLAGPGVSGIFDSSTSNTGEQFEDQAAKIERQLRKDPENPDLLLALTRQRIYAGNALASINPETGEILQTAESRQQLQQASDSWSKYLAATDEPSSGGAQVAANALFSLAQTSATGSELEGNIDAAAEAQQIVAEARPSLGSLSTLAIYRFFAFEYAAAKKAGAEALALASSKFERENLENQLEEIEKNSRSLEKQLEEYEKATAGQGKESLQNPLGGLSGETSLGP
jgi:DNA repair exonuclease SbcCD ATPase subunit